MLKINEQNDSISFKVKIQPNASKNEVCGVVEDYLKIKINAPALDNKANKECISFFAKIFKISKSSVNIIHGEKSREKIIEIIGINRNTLMDWLNC